MKKTKRLIASLLAAALVFTAMPMTAFAGDVTKVTVHGVDVSNSAYANFSTYNQAITNTVQLPLTATELNTSSAVAGADVVFTADDNNNAVARLLTSAQDTTLQASTTTDADTLETALGAAGSDATATATTLNVGDFIWLQDGADTNEKFMRIEITAAASVAATTLHTVAIPELADKTQLKAYTAVVAASAEVNLYPDQFVAPTGGVFDVVLSTGATGLKVGKLTAAADKAIVDDLALTVPATITNAAALVSAIGAGSNALSAATTVKPGEVLWFYDDVAETFFRVVINQASGNDLDGNSTVRNPIKEVVVPVNVNFQINPLQTGNTAGDSNQIYAPAFTVVNKSVDAMKVKFTLTAKAANGAQLVKADNENLDPSNIGATARLFHFAIAAAKDWAPGGTTPSLTDPIPATSTWTFDTADDALYIPFNPATAANNNQGTASVSFLLEPLGTGATAVNKEGLSSFKLYSVLNTYAAGWSPNDITIDGRYDITPIRGDDYNTAETAGLAGLNVYEEPFVPTAGKGLIGARGLETEIGSVAAPSLTYDISEDTNLEIPFFTDTPSGGVVTNMVVSNPSDAALSWDCIDAATGDSPTDTNYNADTLTIEGFDGVATFFGVTSSVPVVKVVLTVDGDEYTVFIRLQA